MLRLCEAVRISSGGTFDISRHRPDGLVDPSGLVKGWAVDEAAAVLESRGARNYAINAGGDILARGEPSPDRAWRVGIQHPQIRDAMAAVIDVRDLAVATSGAYERGEHVINAQTGAPPTDVVSFTVVGLRLAFADAYATAAFAMGAEGIRWIDRLPGYAGCLRHDGRPVRLDRGLRAAAGPSRDRHAAGAVDGDPLRLARPALNEGHGSDDRLRGSGRDTGARPVAVSTTHRMTYGAGP